MKKIFAIVAILMSCMSMQAQDEFRPKGYAGFVEEGLAINVEETAIMLSSTATVHGYQFNPNWFLGGGLAADIYFWSANDKTQTSFNLPIFVDGRWDITKKRICPFIDLRAGYNPIGYKGAYVSPTIGCDFMFRARPKMGMYVGVTYVMQGAKGGGNTNNVGLKVGFRW